MFGILAMNNEILIPAFVLWWFPFACGRETLLFLNEFGNFILAEHAQNSCPLAQNPQKIFNSGTISTVNENPSHSERKPYRLVFQ
jgi:hypothetical protein